MDLNVSGPYGILNFDPSIVDPAREPHLEPALVQLLSKTFLEITY